MVRSHRRRGTSTLGCLVSLVVFLAAMYYGSQVGAIYWRHYSLVDRMRSSARFAATQTNEAIRRQLVTAVDELKLPPEAKRFVIRRLTNPSRIVIETTYEEAIDLPVLHRRVLKFHPRVENRF